MSDKSFTPKSQNNNDNNSYSSFSILGRVTRTFNPTTYISTKGDIEELKNQINQLQSKLNTEEKQKENALKKFEELKNQYDGEKNKFEQKISNLKLELKSELENSKKQNNEFEQKISNLKSELKDDITKASTEIHNQEYAQLLLSRSYTTDKFIEEYDKLTVYHKSLQKKQKSGITKENLEFNQNKLTDEAPVTTRLSNNLDLYEKTVQAKNLDKRLQDLLNKNKNLINKLPIKYLDKNYKEINEQYLKIQEDIKNKFRGFNKSITGKLNSLNKGITDRKAKVQASKIKKMQKVLDKYLTQADNLNIFSTTLDINETRKKIESQKSKLTEAYKTLEKIITDAKLYLYHEININEQSHTFEKFGYTEYLYSLNEFNENVTNGLKKLKSKENAEQRQTIHQLKQKNTDILKLDTKALDTIVNTAFSFSDENKKLVIINVKKIINNIEEYHKKNNDNNKLIDNMDIANLQSMQSDLKDITKNLSRVKSRWEKFKINLVNFFQEKLKLNEKSINWLLRSITKETVIDKQYDNLYNKANELLHDTNRKIHAIKYNGIKTKVLGGFTKILFDPNTKDQVKNAIQKNANEKYQNENIQKDINLFKSNIDNILQNKKKSLSFLSHKKAKEKSEQKKQQENQRDNKPDQSQI